jgi:carboxymethylenebutenolidase
MSTNPLHSVSTRLSGPETNPAVWGRIASPQLPSGTRPGVILLPGSTGWHDTYAQQAEILAETGFAAMALDYLAETGIHPTRQDRLKHWQTWRDILKEAIGMLRSGPCAPDQPIGLVGYSLGAMLALTIAPALPEVAAVVDFFGWVEALEAGERSYPPLLILHGDADEQVPVSEAIALRKLVTGRGGKVEMHIYPKAGHGFNAPWGRHYSELESLDSQRRMAEFLARNLLKR